MKKIMLVFGTRPEAIKMAPLVKAMQRIPERIELKVCVTGQHREMLDQVLHIFDIIPDIDLNIMRSGQDLYDVTSKVLLGMRNVFESYRPDLLLVHGDTTTSMAAAMAAYYSRIKVGHVEAGLRTYNIYSPWPEEINRQIVGRIAEMNFAPTMLSKCNLMREGVNENQIFVTGNTVIDALHIVVSDILANDDIRERTDKEILRAGYDVDRIINDGRKMVLITAHRRENFGEGFVNICEALKLLAQKYPNVDFVYPMHLNPNVRNAVKLVFGESQRFNNNMYFIEPLEYVNFVRLMALSDIVLTDSGGIQEEAPGLGKPVLVMRDTTERPEAVDAGTVKLVGTDFRCIVGEVSRLLDDQEYYMQMSNAVNPYGDGTSSEKILQFIEERFK